ncbi:MAG TPA: PIN domain-containing protein [Chloroflexota bacterium]|nr:PIN domain-containing protein [Chloroflexota bacterium]
MSGEFCDTNVLIYAYDPGEGVKHERAAELVDRLWDSGEGALSIQVLQEFFVVTTRKADIRTTWQMARERVERLASWRLFAPAVSDVLDAIDASARWQLSFWDAMLITAAQKLGANVLWSEDLNAGQRFGAVEVRSPFA